MWSAGSAATDSDRMFAVYDVEADTWDQLPLPPGDAREYALETTGDELILIEASYELGRRPDLRFEPADASWAELPTDPFDPSYDRDLTWTGEQLVLTAIDGTDTVGPAVYQAATWTEPVGWAELPAGEVVGYNPDRFAADGVLINPIPGGTDGGQTGPYDRMLPYGGILDPVAGTWSDLPPYPDDGGAIHGSPLGLPCALGDDDLVVTCGRRALLPRIEEWVEVGAPSTAPEEGAATAVRSPGGRRAVGGAIADTL